MKSPDGSQDTPPAGNAPGTPPRFSFSPKKRVEETPAAAAAPVEPEAPPPPLKRPPPGTRLATHSEAGAPPSGMPAPLTPVKPNATAIPFAAKAKAAPKTNLVMLLALIVLLIATLGEAYIIFMMRDENAAENNQKPPLLVNTGSNAKPLEVVNDGAPPPTPAYGFLLSFSPQIASGNEPRLFFEAKTYRIGEVVAPEFGLKWTRINDKDRELEFTDRQGRRYVKKF